MQNFFINKNSRLPILQMKLLQDGRSGAIAHENFFQAIQNANIYFTMVDIETGMVKIAHQKAFIIENQECTGTFDIAYQWGDRDTMRVGKYRGQFEIVFNPTAHMEFANQNLIVPIADELCINVVDGSIRK